MSWRLPTSAPTSCVGKSVASLCSCYALHFESSTALIIQTRLQFHGFLFSRFFNLRRLCWVRRTPPFPRKSAAILDDFQNPPEKTQLPSANLSGEDVSDAGVLNAAAALPGNSSLSIYTSQNSGVDCSDRPAYSQTKWRGMLNSNHAAINDVKDAKFKWFPYLDQFQVNDRVLRSAEIIEILGPFMLEERKDKIRRVVANRTYTVCPVVEGLLDLGNIAAVFRTADAFGFQSVHVISNDSEKRYKKNRRISMGSEKWLDAELYESTEDCFTELRSRGYRIAVASAAKKSVLMYDVDWTLPTAVVFGNELNGVSTEALRLADFSFYVPMEGMVDSFNVSVAAGIVMHHAVMDRKTQLGRNGDLENDEQRILSADFYLRHNNRSLSIIDALLKAKQEEKKCDLRSVLRGDLEFEVELPEQLKLDLNKVFTESSS